MRVSRDEKVKQKRKTRSKKLYNKKRRRSRTRTTEIAGNRQNGRVYGRRKTSLSTDCIVKLHGLRGNLWSLREFPGADKHGERERERNVLFNDALNTFYLRLYGVRHG